jgi:predicted RNA binding protein YcfA (HicA-like mRNA interferase family)
MKQGNRKVRIPNPHGEDIDISLLAEILRQAGITDEGWIKA